MKKTLMTLGALLALLAVPAASATTYAFVQGGFSEGASLSGLFSGTDLDGDNQLSSLRGEITGFTLSFDGNSLIPAFTLDFDDLFVLVADLDGNGTIGDGLGGDVEAIGADGGLYRYLAGPGPVDVCGVGLTCAVLEGPGFIADFSTQAVSFSVVPAPAALPLFFCALSALLGLRRKSR